LIGTVCRNSRGRLSDEQEASPRPSNFSSLKRLIDGSS
jgi:hypothetical protein